MRRAWEGKVLSSPAERANEGFPEVFLLCLSVPLFHRRSISTLSINLFFSNYRTRYHVQRIFSARAVVESGSSSYLSGTQSTSVEVFQHQGKKKGKVSMFARSLCQIGKPDLHHLDGARGAG